MSEKPKKVYDFTDLEFTDYQGSDDEDDPILFEFTIQHHKPYLGERDRSEHEKE